MENQPWVGKTARMRYMRKGNGVVIIQKEEIIKNVFPFCLHWNLKAVLLNGRISLQTHWRKNGEMYPQLRHNDSMDNREEARPVAKLPTGVSRNHSVGGTFAIQTWGWGFRISAPT